MRLWKRRRRSRFGGESLSITVRASELRDVPVIADIYRFHVLRGTGTFEVEPPDAAEMERRWRELTAGNLPWLVAEDKGQVLGYAYAGPYRPRIGYRFTVEDSVYVRADQAGRGAGSLLLARLIAECESRGLRQMIAVIGDSDNQASIRLHRRFGFRDAGVLREVGFKFGRWLDTVFMQRTLAAGPVAGPGVRL